MQQLALTVSQRPVGSGIFDTDIDSGFSSRYYVAKRVTAYFCRLQFLSALGYPPVSDQTSSAVTDSILHTLVWIMTLVCSNSRAVASGSDECRCLADLLVVMSTLMFHQLHAQNPAQTAHWVQVFKGNWHRFLECQSMEWYSKHRPQPGKYHPLPSSFLHPSPDFWENGCQVGLLNYR